MPKSRVRRKAAYTPPPQPRQREGSPAWLVPTMVTLWVLGLLWIVLHYLSLTSGGLPGLAFLGNWNLLIGFGLVIAGLGLATRWR